MSPRVKRGFWNEFTEKQFSPGKQTPREYYQRLTYLLKNCPEFAPTESFDHLMVDKLVNTMPSTWAAVLNSIHEDPNQKPEHIVQRLENYHQNLRQQIKTNQNSMFKVEKKSVKKFTGKNQIPANSREPKPETKDVFQTTENVEKIEKVGYQSRQGPYSVNSTTTQYVPRCYKCGKMGHISPNCPEERRNDEKGLKGVHGAKGSSKGKGKGKGKGGKFGGKSSSKSEGKTGKGKGKN